MELERYLSEWEHIENGMELERIGVGTDRKWNGTGAVSEWEQTETGMELKRYRSRNRSKFEWHLSRSSSEARWKWIGMESEKMSIS